MKDKILTLIIGILIGAIITAIGFVIYMKTNNVNETPDFGNLPQMNQGQNFNQNGGTPPEFPNGEKPSNNDINSRNAQNNE